MSNKTLYLTLGGSGSIWNGRPNVNDPAPQLYKEYPLPGHTPLSDTWFAVAHNNIDPTGHTANISSSTTFRAVVCGSQGHIMESIRDENTIQQWTLIYEAPNNNQLNGICYGDGIWIAVGENNMIVRSEDLVNWTVINGTTKNAHWTWVIAAPEPAKPYVHWRFVAVGYTSISDPNNPSQNIHTGLIMYSDDGGLTWIKGDNGANAKLLAIAYSPELNTYVTVGSKSQAPDGTYISTILSVNGAG